ncbi:electron transport complex subunit RsxC [bacterium]|nr:electron transport complex subunit RsxC [candidate division CSSED10-310 bacterium]
MKMFTFKRGGIHPPEKKMMSEHQTITSLPLPEIVHVNLGQHLGKPAKPVVSPKQTVSIGERIGEADGFISAHLHSPVSGTVMKIQDELSAVGVIMKTIVIDVDSDKTEVEEQKFLKKEPIDFENADSKTLIENIRDAGVVGLGGATFPTHVKLSPPPDKPIDRIIINGAECEPYLTADHQLMLEKAPEIIKGIRIIQKILNVDNTVIGIESNKPDAAKTLTKAIADSGYRGISVCILKTKYPQGGEKQLIKAITGREVPSGKLPFDVGVLVHNVGTVYSIYEAVCLEKPLIDRITTLTGFVNTPGNFKIKIGTTFNHALIHGAGGTPNEEEVCSIINGGPMMGKSVRNLNVAVMKGTSGILLFSRKDFFYKPEGPCIRCGRCVDACPMGLMPTVIAMNSQYQVSDQLQDAMDCIECGSCSYVCPTSRDLVHWIRIGKILYRNAQRRS